MPLPLPSAREEHLRWLLELTQVPTAAGREWRVVEWIRKWGASRDDISVTPDAAGNLIVAPKRLWRKDASGPGPLLITAHLDHPAFVVERIVAPNVVELGFRGGVRDSYFQRAAVTVHAGGRNGKPERGIPATLVESRPAAGAAFPMYLAEIDPSAPSDDAEEIARGDVATWTLPKPEVDGAGLVHTSACDDLAAAAAALSAFDAMRTLRAGGAPTEDVRLLFTRAEEIGFIGAIAACKQGTIPAGARVIALENSRSFADSPIGGGPIVRVGDRMSIFEPRLTAACARKAEELSALGGEGSGRWRWQRKLMAGGACEATVFCAFGHQATCLCLPLGNYHNMADLDAVQAGTFDLSKGPPRVAREFIHRDDYFGLIDLLVAIGRDLPAADPAMPTIDKLYTKCGFVLDEP